MPLVIPNGFAQFTVNWASPTFNRHAAATVFGMDLSSMDLASATTVVGDAVRDTLCPDINEEVTFDSIVGITELLREFKSYTAMGGRAGSMSPPQVATLVTYGTGLRGPRNRGRAYFPGFLNDDDVTDSGTIDPTRHTGIANAILDFGTAIVTGGLSPVILHTDGGPPTAVTTGVVESKVATQRRRLR